MRRIDDRIWTLLFAAATVGFALTAHREACVAWRWAFLAMAGVALCGGWVLLEDPIGTVLGRSRGGRLGWWIVLATGLAVVAAIAYRWALAEPYLPTWIHGFAVVAVAIGAAEEVLWRGWVQGALEKTLARAGHHGGADIPVCREKGGIFGRQECLPHRGSAAAVMAAAGSHAAYKTALFVFPPDDVARQTPGALLVIAGLTFGFGAMLGVFRLRQGTIAAPLTFHVLFDLLVYGQYAAAPWWVL
jgi:membrane protease YdiL (CAAX protease family)